MRSNSANLLEIAIECLRSKLLGRFKPARRGDRGFNVRRINFYNDIPTCKFIDSKALSFEIFIIPCLLFACPRAAREAGDVLQPSPPSIFLVAVIFPEFGRREVSNHRDMLPTVETGIHSRRRNMASVGFARI